MLVDNRPERQAIPHEPGQWIEVRRLSWLTLKDARKEQAQANREEMKALGAEFVSAILAGRQEDERRVKDRLREQEWELAQFDQATLLYKGLVAWSYEAEVNRDTIGLLDPVTAEWAAGAVLALSRPATEDQRKNVSAPSTVS